MKQKKPATNSKTIVVDSKNAGGAVGSMKFSVILTFIFAAVAVFGVYHHEMWRDEYQAWLIARNSHSLAELFRNCTYEGHPMFWHIILFGLTSITIKPFAMQLLNVAFGAGAVFLFSRFRQSSILQKILFAFSYYVLFEYTMITRYHSLTLFLVLLFCTLYQNRQKNFYWLCLLLVALANTSLIDNVIAIALTLTLGLDYFFYRKQTDWSDTSVIKFSTGLIIVLAGIVVSGLQVMPEEDNMFQPSLSTLANPIYLQALISRIDNAFLLFRNFQDLPNWVTVDQINTLKENINLHFFLSLLLLGVITSALIKKPLSLFLFWSGFSGLMFITGVSYLIAPRYLGNLFILLIASYCIGESFNAHQYKKKWLSVLSSKNTFIRSWLITFILAIQVISGVAFYIEDINRPFSCSKKAAEYIRKEKLGDYEIIGAIDYGASTFAAILDKPVFYPGRNEYGTFVIWDSKRQTADTQILAPVLDSIIGRDNKKYLLVLNYDIFLTDGVSKMILEHAPLTDSVRLDLLASFKGSMVKDESYRIYLPQRINQATSLK
jgi:hypothetical protein